IDRNEKHFGNRRAQDRRGHRGAGPIRPREYPSKYSADTLARDQSVLELGVLDSAGVIELLVFVESTWKIEISDEDITKERAGSLNKMAALVHEYVARKS